MRILRRSIQIGLPVLGTVLILAAVLLLVELRVQLMVVILGILLLQAGVWNMAQSILPSERKYEPLREEVDAFIGLVRQLNMCALQIQDHPSQAADEDFSRIRDAMHDSVETMSLLAGRTEDSAAVEEQNEQ